MFLAAILLVPTLSVHATERDGMTEEKAVEIADNMFENIDASQKILKTSDGGYLIGKATVTSVDDYDEIITTYDSAMDPNSMSVEEAKQDVVNSLVHPEDSSIQPRLASPPTQRWVLALGAEYKSSAFSVSGWRFSGYMFAPEPSSGYYLLWTRYGDDGRVGSLDQAYATLNGSLQGDIIYNGSPTYINKGTLSHMYYTFNPVNGSYYYVQNI